MANKRNHWRQLYSHAITFVCPYCQQTFPIKEATKTFLPPLSRQKPGEPYQIIPACRTCNHEKGALTNKEYKRWKKERTYSSWVRLEEIRSGKTR